MYDIKVLRERLESIFLILSQINLAVVKLISYSCAAGFSRSTRVTCRSLPRCLCRGWVPVKFDQFRFRLSIQIPTRLKDEVKHLDIKHIYSVSPFAKQFVTDVYNQQKSAGYIKTGLFKRCLCVK